MALFDNQPVTQSGSHPRPKGTATAQTAKPAAHFTEVEQEANVPYRGYVDHGLPVSNEFRPDQDESQPAVEDLVTWDTPQDNEPAPIPVYTVPGPGESGTVHRMFRTWYESASSVIRMIAGRHDARSKIKIANNSGNTVWVGADLSVSPMNGYPLLTGQTLELTTNREVYVLIDPAVAAGTVAALSVLEEYTVQR